MMAKTPLPLRWVDLGKKLARPVRRPGSAKKLLEMPA
jgi:hypothetical protein